MGKTRAQTAANENKRDMATKASSKNDKHDKNDKNDKNDKDANTSVALAATLHENRNRDDAAPRTTTANAIIQQQQDASANAASDDSATNNDKLKVVRVPAALRRTVPELKDVDSIPFIVRGAGARNDKIVATRCRMTYACFRMAYFSERAFVRDAAHQAKKIVFFRTQGARPLIIFIGFNEHDPKTDIGITTFLATMTRVIEPTAIVDSPTFSITADGDTDRTCHLVFAPQNEMIVAKKLVDSFSAIPGHQVGVKQHRDGNGNNFFTGFLRRASDVIHDVDRSEDDVGDAPPISTIFNEHGWKDRTSYITGLETATVNLTSLEANQLRHQALVMPLAALEVHDPRRDNRLMTLRWKEKVIVPTFYETLLNIQRDVGCFVFPMTYGRRPPRLDRHSATFRRRV